MARPHAAGVENDNGIKARFTCDPGFFCVINFSEVQIYFKVASFGSRERIPDTV